MPPNDPLPGDPSDLEAVPRMMGGMFLIGLGVGGLLGLIVGAATTEFVAEQLGYTTPPAAEEGIPHDDR